MGIVPAIIAGVSSLVGSFASWRGQREANKTNIQLAQQGQEFEQKMWEQQNAYNSPSAIMARYSDAGLNPNLIYGSGNATGNASSMPQARVASVESELKNITLPNALNILSMYQDYRNKKAVEDQTKSVTALNNLRAITEGLQPQLIRSNIDLVDTKQVTEMFKNQNLDLQNRYLDPYLADRNKRLRYGNVLLQQQATINPLKITELDELIKKIRLENIAKSMENDMQSTLKDFNMTNQDSIWARLIARIMHSFN